MSQTLHFPLHSPKYWFIPVIIMNQWCNTSSEHQVAVVPCILSLHLLQGLFNPLNTKSINYLDWLRKSNNMLLRKSWWSKCIFSNIFTIPPFYYVYMQNGTISNVHYICISRRIFVLTKPYFPATAHYASKYTFSHPSAVCRDPYSISSVTYFLFTVI